MKTIEQKTSEIMARAQVEVEKAQKECSIYELLPVAPNMVHVRTLWGTPASVSYKVKTKPEALAIAQQFQIVPAYICKDSCTSIKPYSDEKAREVCEIFAWVSIDQYKSELAFYAQVGADILRVSVEIPTDLFGAYRKSDHKAKINFTMDWQPLPKTCEMFQAIRYARAYHRGPESGHNVIYAIYDKYELVNQFEEVEL